MPAAVTPAVSPAPELLQTVDLVPGADAPATPAAPVAPTTTAHQAAKRAHPADTVFMYDEELQTYVPCEPPYKKDCKPTVKDSRLTRVRATD